MTREVDLDGIPERVRAGASDVGGDVGNRTLFLGSNRPLLAIELRHHHCSWGGIRTHVAQLNRLSPETTRIPMNGEVHDLISRQRRPDPTIF